MAQTYVSRSPAAGILHYARTLADLSQEELAKRAGVPPTMISAYERDKRQPTLPTLMRLLKAAGYEMRIQLEPYDTHDDVLSKLEENRSPEEVAKRNLQMAAWREAKVSDQLDKQSRN